MKKNSTLIKEQRVLLHYYQQLLRVDLRAAEAGKRKCREIGAEMRRLQRESK